RNRLEAGYLPCLKNQLDVLADPTLAPISVDNRALIVSIFLLTPQLPQVESCGCMALVRADQLQVGTADHLGLAEAERRQCRGIAEREPAVLVGPVNQISGEFHHLAVLLLFGGQDLLHGAAPARIG